MEHLAQVCSNFLFVDDSFCLRDISHILYDSQYLNGPLTVCKSMLQKHAGVGGLGFNMFSTAVLGIVGHGEIWVQFPQSVHEPELGSELVQRGEVGPDLAGTAEGFLDKLAQL